MKTQEEFKSSILQKKERYLQKRKRNRKNIFLSVAAGFVCCIPLFYLLHSLGLGLSGAKNADPLSNLANSAYDSSAISSITASVDSILFPEQPIKITVASLPTSAEYSRTFTDAEKINQIYTQLIAFPFSSPSDNPDLYAGMTLVITFTEKDGKETVYYSFGNRFFRQESKPWHEIPYQQAESLEKLLLDLPSDPIK